MTELGLESRLSDSEALSHFFTQSLEVKSLKAADSKLATTTTNL